MYANAPDQRRILHGGHPLYPISNELKKNQPRKHGRLMWLRKTISEALFFCLLLFTTGKTVIKADQKSSFYLSSMIYCTKNILRRDNAIATMSLYVKLQKKNKQKVRISNLKVHPVSSFAPCISGLQTFRRKQVVNNDFFASQPCTTECTARFSQRLYSESSQTCICLAVILMHLFNFLDGLY